MTATRLEGREGPEPDRLPPLGLVGSAALFGASALLLLLTTQVAVPALVSATGVETVVAWFLAASAVLFGPLLLVAALLLWRRSTWAGIVMHGGFGAMGFLAIAFGLK